MRDNFRGGETAQFAGYIERQAFGDAEKKTCCIKITGACRIDNLFDRLCRNLYSLVTREDNGAFSAARQCGQFGIGLRIACGVFKRVGLIE